MLTVADVKNNSNSQMRTCGVEDISDLHHGYMEVVVVGSLPNQWITVKNKDGKLLVYEDGMPIVFSSGWFKAA